MLRNKLFEKKGGIDQVVTAFIVSKYVAIC